MKWKDIRYPYWHMFILLEKVNSMRKASSLDEIKSIVERSISQEMLEWLRVRGYVKETIRDDVSFFSTTIRGNVFIGNNKETVDAAIKSDKDDVCEKLFNKTKPTWHVQVYHSMNEFSKQHPFVLFLITVILGILALLPFFLGG